MNEQTKALEELDGACKFMDETIFKGVLDYQPEHLAVLKSYMDRWEKVVTVSERNFATELAAAMLRPLPKASEIEKALWQAVANEADYEMGEKWIPRWGSASNIRPERGDDSLHTTLYEFVRPFSDDDNATKAMFRVCMNSKTKDLSLLEGTTGGALKDRETFICVGRFSEDPEQILKFNIRNAAKALQYTLEHVFEDYETQSAVDRPRGN